MEELLKWCKAEQAMMRKQIKLMQEGTLMLFSLEDGKKIDETQDWISEYQKKDSRAG